MVNYAGEAGDGRRLLAASPDDRQQRFGRARGANYVIARGRRRGGALVFEA